MILCTLVTDSEVANGKDARGLYEMQLGAWVVVQLQGIVANQGQNKPFYYLSVAYLSTSCLVS